LIQQIWSVKQQEKQKNGTHQFQLQDRVMIDNEKLTDTSSIELLSFRVGGQDYSVDIMSVREIRGSAKATSLPHAPSFVKGVINLRGTVLPILDLSARLGLEMGQDTERNVIIVVDLGGRTAGLMVDAVSDILAIPFEAMQAPPDLAADESRTFVSSLTIVDGRMIRILDLEAVMPPQGEEAA
jgi:purine-binding chemotaxis protein CheW